MYGVGARLDEKPDLLFLLRKVDHLELIIGAVDDAPAAELDKSRGRKTIATGDLADVFGIEMAGPETQSDDLTARAEETPKPIAASIKKISKKEPRRTVAKEKKAAASPAAKQGKPKKAKPHSGSPSQSSAKSSSRRQTKQEMS
jgi:hypothetical protein